ncbi:zinc finger protein Xfin-like [Anopheles maculipalpis]|uniref:zinc finger protein Xfin-like n=1 Tax=Anopheles maculipalpis TaxID=1496333 RepID=UPI002158FA01|nr:zinc finger protein Xfin-like [Anopheles maculipalpis]
MSSVKLESIVPPADNVFRCRICSKTVHSQKALCIFSLLDGTKEKDATKTIAEMIGEFADVTINAEDDRSKFICTFCMKAVEGAAELRQQIRTSEGMLSTILESLQIESLTEQDYRCEYLEEFKDEIETISQPKTTHTEDETSQLDDHTKQLNLQLLSDDDMDSLEDDIPEQGKHPFVMPQPDLIGIRLEFENFEYLEIRGERCCGCEHIAACRDALMEHAKEKHSQKYYADSSYTCPTCYGKFATADALEKHQQYYLYSDVFLCTICQEAFNLQSHLMRHLKENHQVQQQAGSEQKMERTPPKSDELNLPLTTLPDEKFIKETRDYPQYRLYCVSGERCCACGVHLTNLEQHITEYHINMDDMLGTDELRCTICRRTFATRQEQLLHEERRLNLNQIYQCKLCHVLFARKLQLIKHFRTSSKNHCNGLVETIAESITSNAEKGEPTAELVPASRMNYFCCCFSRCKEEYACEKDLLDHVVKVHSGRRKENEHKLGTQQRANMSEHLICPVCRRSFDSVAKVTKHRTYKLTLPKQTCRQCGQIFMKATGLQEHQLREHLSLKLQFGCDVCGKQFVTRSTLNKHRQVHEPFQNYPCSVAGCEVRFRNEQLMQRHYRNVHMELKAYECGYCGKMYRTKESLDIHERSHTGEKPFGCRHAGCSKRYAHGSDRMRHERSAHTGEKPHTCPVCKMGFLRKREMRLHMEKVH